MATEGFEVFGELGVHAAKVGDAQRIHLRDIVDGAVLREGVREVVGRVGAAGRIAKAERNLVAAPKALKSRGVYDPWKVKIAGMRDVIEAGEHGAGIGDRPTHNQFGTNLGDVGDLDARRVTAAAAVHRQPDELLAEHVDHIVKVDGGVFGGRGYVPIDLVIGLDVDLRRSHKTEVHSNDLMR